MKYLLAAGLLIASTAHAQLLFDQNSGSSPAIYNSVSTTGTLRASSITVGSCVGCGSVSSTTNTAAAAVAANTSYGFNAYNLGNTNGNLHNTVIGQSLLNGTATNASGNVLIGDSIASGTLSNATGTYYNVIIGSASAPGLTDAHENISIGSNNITGLTTGSFNTTIGSQVGTAITTGSNNTCIGIRACFGLTTGSFNIAIASSDQNLSFPSNTGSNQLNINNVIMGNLSLSTLPNTGLIGINVPSPTANFEVSGTVKLDSLTNSAGTGPVCYSTSTHLITTNTVACTVSDIRLKKNIEPYTGALDKVMQLRMKQFDFRDIAYGTQHQVGLIAQEVEQVIPAVVGTGSDGFKSVGYDKLSVYAIGAIQEQQAEINDLRITLGLQPTTFMQRLAWLFKGK